MTNAATLNGVPFRTNPTIISWDFKPKVVSHKTVGGKVVQVFGVEFGDLVVEGSFGIGGWEEQQAFLDRMKALGDNQMDHFQVNHPTTPQPYRFFWGDKGWDMLVWLKGYEDGSGASVTLANEQINPRWVLTLHIVEDNSGLKKVAADAFIERLSAGLGWQQTEFNGPVDGATAVATMKSLTGADNITDFLNIAFGKGTQTPVGNTTGSTTTTPILGTAGSLTADEVARIAYAAGFRGEGLVTAIAVAFAESGGRTDSLGKNTNGSRDRGLWQINTIHGYTDAEMFDPNKNAQVAFAISHQGTNWGAWVAYNTGRHEQFMSAARAAAAKVDH